MGSRRDKKELIREAAVELFARDGYHATTTDRVAHRAGVAVGTIYNYFRNKREILDYIFLSEHSKRAKIYEGLRSDKKPPLEKLRLMISRHFDEVAEDTDLVRVILREVPNASPAVRDTEGMKGFLAEIIAEGIHSGHFRSLDPQVCATMLVGMVKAIMGDFIKMESEGRGDPDIFECALDNLIQILEGGLVSPRKG